MSGVQTNWHLDGLVLDDSDPMADISELKSTAKVIDLAQSEAELTADLQRSVGLETYIFDAYNGLHCRIKADEGHAVWGGGRTSCYGCPHYTKDPERVQSLICREGRHQEDLLSELSVVGEGDRLDRELASAYERDMAACDELVAACEAA